MEEISQSKCTSQNIFSFASKNIIEVVKKKTFSQYMNQITKLLPDTNKMIHK